MAFTNSLTRLSELIVDLLRTADPPNARWEIGSTTGNQIRGYSGLGNETTPGTISANAAGQEGAVTIASPILDIAGTPSAQSSLSVRSDSDPITGHSSLWGLAQQILFGAVKNGAGWFEARADQVIMRGAGVGGVGVGLASVVVTGSDFGTPDAVDIKSGVAGILAHGGVLTTQDGLRVGNPAQQSVAAFTFGASTVVTNASGQAVVNHGLVDAAGNPLTPTVILPSFVGIASLELSIAAKTNTTFTIQAKTTNTAAAFVGNLPLMWIALA